MPKKSYQKPEIKEVKLIMEDTFLSSCRSGRTSTAGARTVSTRNSARNCACCRGTYANS